MITISAKISKEIYNLIETELNKMESKLSQTKLNLEFYQKRIEHLKILRQSIRDNICRKCNGIGQIRNFIAQDESRLENCEYCKGKGYLEG